MKGENMEIIQNKELDNINGGGKLLWYALGAIGILVVGIIDGIINPQKCNR